MKRLIPVLFLIALSTVCPASVFRGCCGGMMIHSGYVQSKSFGYITPEGIPTAPGKISGAPFGIGGAAKVILGEHLRVGGEGYVSTLNYGEHKSYSSTGWGGLLADFFWSRGRWSWFAGATIGGGGVKNVTLFEDIPLDLEIEKNTVSYRRYGFMGIAPYIGAEYALTKKIHLIFKADWLMNVSNPQPDFLSGPRFYIGFNFCHNK